MAVMGLFSNIFGRSQPSRSKAANFFPNSLPLEQQLIEAKARLVYLKALPLSAWHPTTTGGIISSYSVDKRANDIAYVRADIARLKTRLKLSQRLAQAQKLSQTEQERSKATLKERDDNE